MINQPRYAVVDGALEDKLLDFLAQHNPPHCCLYAEPLQQALIPLAPYLIQVTEEVTQWLNSKTTAWGIYLFTSATMKEVRHHLRKYLQIIIPAEEKPVFFRFYDPRNIWDFCEVLTDWELHCFMGPIDKIATACAGNNRSENFQSVRAAFPVTAKNSMKMFKINQMQFDALNERAEIKYIKALTIQIKLRYRENRYNVPVAGQQKTGTFTNAANNSLTMDASAQMVEDIVKDCYYFCQANAIEDDRSVRGLLHLLLQNNIFSIEQISEAWREQLSNRDLPGYFRVESLLKEELGYIPQ